jgi:chromosome segregation ATPase
MTPDLTMTALLDVHRREVAERDAEIGRLKNVTDTLQYELAQCKAEAKRRNERIETLLKDRAEQIARIEKLDHIVTTLKIELANERAEHTKARERDDG